MKTWQDFSMTTNLVCRMQCQIWPRKTHDHSIYFYSNMLVAVWQQIDGGEQDPHFSQRRSCKQINASTTVYSTSQTKEHHYLSLKKYPWACSPGRLKAPSWVKPEASELRNFSDHILRLYTSHAEIMLGKELEQMTKPQQFLSLFYQLPLNENILLFLSVELTTRFPPFANTLSSQNLCSLLHQTKIKADRNRKHYLKQDNGPKDETILWISSSLANFWQKIDSSTL